MSHLLKLIPQSRDRRPRLSARIRVIEVSQASLGGDVTQRVLQKDDGADRRGRLSLLDATTFNRTNNSFTCQSVNPFTFPHLGIGVHAPKDIIYTEVGHKDA